MQINVGALTFGLALLGQGVGRRSQKFELRNRRGGQTTGTRKQQPRVDTQPSPR